MVDEGSFKISDVKHSNLESDKEKRFSSLPDKNKLHPNAKISQVDQKRLE